MEYDDFTYLMLVSSIYEVSEYQVFLSAFEENFAEETAKEAAENAYSYYLRSQQINTTVVQYAKAVYEGRKVLVVDGTAYFLA